VLNNFAFSLWQCLTTFIKDIIKHYYRLNVIDSFEEEAQQLSMRYVHCGEHNKGDLKEEQSFKVGSLKNERSGFY